MKSLGKYRSLSKIGANDRYMIKKIFQNKYLDLIFVFVVPFVVFLAVFIIGINITYLESLALIFGIPSLYLSFRAREKVRKVAIFSLLVSIPVAITVELMSVWDRAWIVQQSSFPIRLFGFSPVENYIWQFLTIYTILIFYEHFCNKKFQPDISKRIWAMCLILYSLACAVIILFIAGSPLLHISYPYLWFCVPFFIMPVILFLAKYPSFFVSFLKAQLFFLYIHTIFETIGIKLNQWIYPSIHYIGWVTLFGQKMPLEEFIFIMLFGAFAACTYYEFFTNNNLCIKI